MGMPVREKVIHDLECCALGNCDDCFHRETRCTEHLCASALRLIRDQEAREDDLLKTAVDEFVDFEQSDPCRVATYRCERWYECEGKKPTYECWLAYLRWRYEQTWKIGVIWD